MDDENRMTAAVSTQEDWVAYRGHTLEECGCRSEHPEGGKRHPHTTGKKDKPQPIYRLHDGTLPQSKVDPKRFSRILHSALSIQHRAVQRGRTQTRLAEALVPHRVYIIQLSVLWTWKKAVQRCCTFCSNE